MASSDDKINSTEKKRLTVGELLRATRLENKYSIQDVAKYLRIRPSLIEALEKGKYSDLPAPVYAIGFVRSYAEYMGHDVELMIRRFKSEVTDMSKEPRLNFITPENETLIPGGAILLISILLACVVYGVWYHFSTQDKKLIDLIPPLPAHLEQSEKTPT